MPRKLVFQFGDISLTLTPDDIEAVLSKLKREPTSEEFADAVVKYMIAKAKPTRTVLHN